MKRRGVLVGYVVVNRWFWPNPVVCGEGSEIYSTYKEAYRELKRAREEARDACIQMMAVIEPARRGPRNTQ